MRGIRQRTLDLAVYLNDTLPASRELSLAQTKLEEARMWACSAATLHGEIREPLEINRPHAAAVS